MKPDSLGLETFFNSIFNVPVSIQHNRMLTCDGNSYINSHLRGILAHGCVSQETQFHRRPMEYPISEVVDRHSAVLVELKFRPVFILLLQDELLSNS